MEEKRDIKQSHQQEEKPDKQVEADQEEKDIPILKENQLLEDTEIDLRKTKEKRGSIDFKDSQPL